MKRRVLIDPKHPDIAENTMSIAWEGEEKLGYVCPSCGGYGYVVDKDSKCDVCPDAAGIIPFNDERIQDAE